KRGRRRVRRCVGARTRRPSEVSPENHKRPECRQIWAIWRQQRSRGDGTGEWAHSAGVRWGADSKEATQEHGRPPRSVENRRPEARETRAEAECEVGVGGTYRSDDAGERVTPDPAEQRGPASDRTSGGNHERREDVVDRVTRTREGSGESE